MAKEAHANARWQLTSENPRRYARGGISPVLSNLFLHYVFDSWIKITHPSLLWCRYADDAVVHCKTEVKAQQLLAELELRFKEFGLELHPEKTKIVYCKDAKRGNHYSKTEFDFPGFTFRTRLVKKTNAEIFFMSFTPAVSRHAVNSMRAETRRRSFRNRTDMSLNDIAKQYNPVLQGWINYYGRYRRSSLYPVLGHFINRTLVAWAMRKCKKLRSHKIRASCFVQNIAKRQPNLFIHWKIGMFGSFA